MKHIVFARFPDSQQATAGVRTLHADGVTNAQIVLHTGATDAAALEQQVQHSSEFGETDLRHALVVGSISGTTCGAVLGTVLAALGIFPGSLSMGFAFGAFMGLLEGLLMMSVFGTGLMDRRLQRLARGLHAGEIVVTVRTEDGPSSDHARQILERTGAQVAEKSFA